MPKAGGGLYWPDDKEDSRDFRRGFDQSDIMERAIITEILQKLDKQKWLAMPRGYDKLLTELRIPKERREQIINQFATILTKGFLARLKQAKDDAARISDKEKAAAKDLTKLLTELRIPKERREQITKVVEDILERGANAEGYLISLLETAFSPIMKRSRVTELTEYNRTVHAEAAASAERTTVRSDGSSRARRMLVASQPAGVPTSSSVPSYSTPHTGPDRASIAMASVSWISPRAPGAVWRSASKMPGVST